MTGVLALARFEARLYVHHPLFLAGAGLALLATVLVPTGNADLDRYGIVAGAGLLPLTAAVMMVAALSSGRRRRDGIEGPDDAYPLGAPMRVCAQMLAGMSAPGVGLLLMVPVWLLYVGLDGAMVVEGVRWQPGLADLAQGPVLLATFSLAGVAIGLGSSRPWLPVVIAMATVWSPLTWFNPWIVADPAVADPMRETVASASWQIVYLLGISVAAVALALARTGRRVLWIAVASAGLGAGAAGGILRFA